MTKKQLRSHEQNEIPVKLHSGLWCLPDSPKPDSPKGVTINRTAPHRATPDHTGPEMTDYFALTTVMSRIKA